MIIVTFVECLLHASHCCPYNSLVKIVPTSQVRTRRSREIEKSGHQRGWCQSHCPKHKAVPYYMPVHITTAMVVPPLRVGRRRLRDNW